MVTWAHWYRHNRPRPTAVDNRSIPMERLKIVSDEWYLHTISKDSKLFTYQSQPNVTFHDLIFLVLKSRKVEIVGNTVFHNENKNAIIIRTTLMSWMKANPKATSTFCVMFCTGLMSLLYPLKRSRTSLSSSWEHRPANKRWIHIVCFRLHNCNTVFYVSTLLLASGCT